MENVLEQAQSYIATYGLRVVGAIVILIVGRIAAGITRKLVKKLMARTSVDATITTFATSLSYALVITVTVLAALPRLGVEVTSFVAILGAATLAIGFALQSSLSNFASGVLTLVLRPYRVGDFIDAGGVMGTVKEVGFFTTVMSTPDNVRILVPNSKIYGDIIKNFSVNPTRRIDLVIGIGYDSSIKKAHELLRQILSEDERILADPEPYIGVAELADSSVNFVVRPWVNRQDFWATKCDLTEKIKETFDQHGIEIPFPQRTVHMVGAAD